MDEESMSGPQTVRVRIANGSPTEFDGSETPTGGQIWITPGAYAVHAGENPVFTEGESASVGLEALAEAGPPTGFKREDGLVDELDAMSEDGLAHAGVYAPEDTVADPNDPTGEVPGAPPIAPGGAFESDVQVEPGQRLSFVSMFVPSNDVFFSPDSQGIALWPEDGDPLEGGVVRSIEDVDDGHDYPEVSETIQVTVTPTESMNDSESIDDSESTDDEG